MRDSSKHHMALQMNLKYAFRFFYQDVRQLVVRIAMLCVVVGNLDDHMNEELLKKAANVMQRWGVQCMKLGTASKC